MSQSPRGVFVAGIGTDVGKSIASAIICQALEADYWKPVQTGSSHGSDMDTVQSLVLNSKSRFHREAYSFKLPLVPYTAAEAEGVEIDPASIVRPKSENLLVVEGAGGVVVPLTMQYTMLDLLISMQLPVILVSKFYLGSINHTLLTVEALRARGIPILGLIFNGMENRTSRALILAYTKLQVIGSLRTETYLDSLVVKGYADEWRPQLTKLIV